MYVTDHIKYYQLGGNPQPAQQLPQPQSQQAQSGDNEIMELLQAYFQMNQMSEEQIQQFMQEFQQLKPEEQQQVIQHIQEQIQASGQQPQEQQGEPQEQTNGQPMEQESQMATGGIHIKKSHVGLFTEKAKRAGMGVQEYAHHVMTHSTDPTLRKEANFAINFGGKHQAGGQFDYNKKPLEWFDIPQNITDRFSYVDAPKNTFTDFSNSNMNFTGDSPRYLYDSHQDKYLLRNNVGQYRLADPDKVSILKNAPKRQVGGIGSSMSFEMANPVLPVQYDSVHTGGYNQGLDKYGFNNKKTNRQFQVGGLDENIVPFDQPESYNGVLPLPASQTMEAVQPPSKWQIPMLAPVQSQSQLELPLVSHADVAKYAPPVTVSQVNKAASKPISQLTNKDKQVLSIGHSDAQALQAYLDANGGKTMSKKKSGEYDGIIGANTINAMKQVYEKETGKTTPSANELSKYFNSKVQGSGIKITHNDIKANLVPAYQTNTDTTKSNISTTPTGAETNSNNNTIFDKYVPKTFDISKALNSKQSNSKLTDYYITIAPDSYYKDINNQTNKGLDRTTWGKSKVSDNFEPVGTVNETFGSTLVYDRANKVFLIRTGNGSYKKPDKETIKQVVNKTGYKVK